MLSVIHKTFSESESDEMTDSLHVLMTISTRNTPPVKPSAIEHDSVCLGLLRARNLDPPKTKGTGNQMANSGPV